MSDPSAGCLDRHRASVAVAVAGSLSLALAAGASAVTIDDFAVPLPFPLDTSGTSAVTQSGIAVFGGTRTTRVFTFGVQPSGAQIIANPTPPPSTNVVSMVLGSDAGGRLELRYPQSPPADLTLGVADGSAVEIRSTLGVAGGRVILELEDAGGASASRSIPSVAFAGSGEVDYLFFLEADTFPGIDLEQVADIRASVEAESGADFDLSNVSVDILASEMVDWDEGIAFQSAAGFVDPAVLVGFNPQPEPPGVDLTDPFRPVITLPTVPPEPIKVAIGSYGTTQLVGALVVDGGEIRAPLAGFEDFTLVIGASGPSGEVMDPGSLVGFNPQPEPPPGSLVGFNPQPEPPPGPDALGAEVGLAALGGAATLAGSDVTTLTIEILDANGDPIALQQVEAPSVPVLGAAWVLLAAVLAAATLAALRQHRDPAGEDPRMTGVG